MDKTFIFLLPAAIFGIKPTLFENGSLVGVVFSPFNKYTSDKSDYSDLELETMLKVISTRFQKVTTYGMGTTDVLSHWNEIKDAAARVPFAAANLNKKLGTTAIIIEVAAWQGDLVTKITRKEIQNVFDVANDSNVVHNGTVSGIIMSTHYDDHQLVDLLKSLLENENRSKSLHLDVGIRSSSCDSLTLKATQSTVNSTVIINIIKKLDFIICGLMPEGKDLFTNITQSVEVIGNKFLQWRKDFRKINPIINTFGQTGWPSEDTSIEGVQGSVNNVKQFWTEMSEWSTTNHFRVDMFEAFDEPWKWRRTSPAESHFGWWVRTTNATNEPEAFAEKIYYQEPGKSYGLEIGLGLSGTFFILLIFGSIFYLYTRLVAVQSQLLTQKEIEEFEDGKKNIESDEPTDDALSYPYDKSYEISKSKFLIDKTNLLGSGAFGTVYKGKLIDNPNYVAFKMTRPTCTANNLKNMLSEIKIMTHVGKHENVVSIIGAYTGEMKQGMVILAIDLCESGSLEKYLRTNKNSMLKLSPVNEFAHYTKDPTAVSKPLIQMEDLVRWSLQIACGMEHIASKHVIHADLAIRNVLLTEDKTAKIADFGLSRHLYEYTNYVKTNQEPLPWRWMAVESLQHMTFSTKSDVWSFGITLWEIFSMGDLPYPGLSWTTDFPRKLRQGLQMEQPEYASPQIYTKMFECWNDDPVERPDFTDIKDFFLNLPKETTTPEYLDILTSNKNDINDIGTNNLISVSDSYFSLE